MPHIQAELKYQNKERKDMEEEASYMLDKWELTMKEYTKRVADIIEGYEQIVQEIYDPRYDDSDMSGSSNEDR